MDIHCENMVRRKVSHFGCLGCKNARVKCDELKPKCSRCRTQRISCEYSNEWRRARRRTNIVYPACKVSSGYRRDGSQEMLEPLLMHQWCVETCFTIPIPGCTDLLQRTLPRIGFEHRYLLDAIFLLTSAHINCTKLTERRIDKAIVEKYKHSVISSLRTRLSPGVTRNNGEALFGASMLLAIFSIVSDPEVEFTSLNEAWMTFFQGSQQVYQQLEKWTNCFDDLHRLALIDSLPDGKRYVHNYDKVLKLAEANAHIFLSPVRVLSRLAERIMTNPDSHCLLFIVSWIMRLPKEFVLLVDQFDPCALVLVANFFQTLTYARNSWLFEDNAKRHQQRICRRIPYPWHIYLIDMPVAAGEEAPSSLLS